MRSTIALMLLLLLVSSCKEETAQNNLTINGSIKGLKVGKILLQKIADTTLVTLDSVLVDGTSDFSLTTVIDEPQLLYLYLDVKDGSTYDDRIAFFAEDTVMTINSTLKDFEKDVVITGSKNQDLLTVFKENTNKLDLQYTDLVKRSIALSNKENASPAEVEELNAAYDKYIRKRILYAISYASVHKEKEIAPYILVQEAFDANPKLIDSVYKMMPKKIQTSLYGKELSELLNKIKEN